MAVTADVEVGVPLPFRFAPSVHPPVDAPDVQGLLFAFLGRCGRP